MTEQVEHDEFQSLFQWNEGIKHLALTYDNVNDFEFQSLFQWNEGIKPTKTLSFEFNALGFNPCFSGMRELNWNCNLCSGKSR